MLGTLFNQQHFSKTYLLVNHLFEGLHRNGKYNINNLQRTIS